MRPRQRRKIGVGGSKRARMMQACAVARVSANHKKSRLTPPTKKKRSDSLGGITQRNSSLQGTNTKSIISTPSHNIEIRNNVNLGRKSSSGYEVERKRPEHSLLSYKQCAQKKKKKKKKKSPMQRKYHHIQTFKSKFVNLNQGSDDCINLANRTSSSDKNMLCEDRSDLPDFFQKPSPQLASSLQHKLISTFSSSQVSINESTTTSTRRKQSQARQSTRRSVTAGSTPPRRTKPKSDHLSRPVRNPFSNGNHRLPKQPIRLAGRNLYENDSTKSQCKSSGKFSGMTHSQNMNTCPLFARFLAAKPTVTDIVNNDLHFKNLSNTCYINVVFQVLLRSRLVIQQLRHNIWVRGALENLLAAPQGNLSICSPITIGVHDSKNITSQQTPPNTNSSLAETPSQNLNSFDTLSMSSPSSGNPILPILYFSICNLWSFVGKKKQNPVILTELLHHLSQHSGLVRERGRQQDAQEFLTEFTYLLDLEMSNISCALEKRLSVLPSTILQKKLDEDVISPFGQLFTSLIRNTVCCTACGHTRYRDEAYRSFSLPICLPSPAERPKNSCGDADTIITATTTDKNETRHGDFVKNDCLINNDSSCNNDTFNDPQRRPQLLQTQSKHQTSNHALQHDFLDVKQLFQQTLSPETVEFRCEKCSQGKTSTVSKVLCSPAPILVFNLKRFKVDPQTLVSTKCCVPVKAPHILHLDELGCTCEGGVERSMRGESNNKKSRVSQADANESGQKIFRMVPQPVSHSHFHEIINLNLEKWINGSHKTRKQEVNADLQRKIKTILSQLDDNDVVAKKLMKQDRLIPTSMPMQRSSRTPDCLLQKLPAASYRLKAVIHHLGSTLKAGHYVTDIRSDSGSGWTRFNDSTSETLLDDEHVQKHKDLYQTSYIFLYEAIEQ